MEQIKNLIFDLGVVLLNLNRQACMQAFKDLGIENIEEMTSVALHKGIFGDFEKGTLTLSEFYRQVRSLAGSPIDDELIRDAWLKMIEEIPAFKLDKLIELQDHYRVFLLSNTNELHWQYCIQNTFPYKGYQVEDLFEKIWLSNEIHLLKPSREIFDFVLKDAEIKPHETLFLDDAPANCEAARQLGIKTYQPIEKEDWSHLFNLKQTFSV